LEIGLAASPYIPTTTTTAQAGVLENTPRLNYTTGVANPSLLLEPSRTQLVTKSELFSGGFWGNYNSTTTDNQTTAPDGLLTASKFSGTSDVTAHTLYLNPYPVVSGNDYTYSVFAKKNENNFIQINTGQGFGNLYANFDLDNGVVGSFNTLDANIKPYLNGWFKCSVKANSSTSTGQSTFSLIQSSTDVRNPSFNALNNSVYIWGAQLEQGSYPTSYIPNHSGGSVTRGVDVISKDLTSVINNNQMTMFVDVKSLTSITTIIAADGFGDLRWYHQAGNRFRFYKMDDADWITNSFVVNDGDKIALTITDTQAKLFVNGAQVGTTFTLTTSFQNFSNLNYNVGSSKNEWNQLLFFSTPLSDAECITLTTI